AAANLFRRPRQIFIERISDFNCRTRLRPSGDQNSLLNSDMLNAGDPSQIGPLYSPNNWMFNPNWGLIYDANSSTASRPAAVGVPVGPPVSHCPPPPPYSP